MHKRLCLLCCIIVVLPYIAANRILDEVLKQDTLFADYINLTLYMTKRFISPKTNTLIISEKCEFDCEEHRNRYGTLLHYLGKNLNETLSVQLLLADNDERLWDYNMLVVDSWISFKSLPILLAESKYGRNFYFYILLIRGTDNELFFNIKEIFKLCIKVNVNNVVVMYYSKFLGCIAFYSYQHYSIYHCDDKMTVREVNRFQDGQLENDFLFPEQIMNYYGCTLNVSAYTVKPFIVFDGEADNKTHLEDMHRLGGLEGSILLLLANALNFKIRMRLHGPMNSSSFRNSSAGCFGDLAQGIAHVAIGGLNAGHDKVYNFTRSIEYHATSYNFVVRNDILFGPIKQLINPFKELTWLLLIANFIVLVAVIQILGHFKDTKIRDFILGPRNKYPIYNLITTFLGYSLPAQILPKRNFARFILMSWLLLTLALRNGYQGKMFDSLRLAKRSPVPRTIAELIRKDYRFIHPFYTHFYPANKTVLMDETVREVRLSEKRVTAAVLMDYLIQYNYDHRENRSLSPVDEVIFAYQFVMYFPKYSTLRESFDRKLKLYRSAGIISYFAKKLIYLHTQDLNAEAEDVGVITFENLRGLYYIYLALCGISIVLFALEMLTKKSKKIKMIMDCLN